MCKRSGPLPDRTPQRVGQVIDGELAVHKLGKLFCARLHGTRANRPVENRWVGQHISEPDIDLAGMARAQGAQGFGPVTTISNLTSTFEKAIAAVETGAVAVVDVRVEPGYTAATTAAMTRKSE